MPQERRPGCDFKLPLSCWVGLALFGHERIQVYEATTDTEDTGSTFLSTDNVQITLL